MDGKSFAPQLLGGEDWGTVAEWRNFSFSEFFPTGGSESPSLLLVV